QLNKTTGTDGKARPAKKCAAQPHPPKQQVKTDDTKSESICINVRAISCDAHRVEKFTKPGVNVRDIALQSFDAHVLELVRQTKNQATTRFIKSAVSRADLIRLSAFLSDLADEFARRPR